MISRLRDISLRAKITVSFVLIVLGGTFVSTSIGSRIIANAMRKEALKQASRGLETAGTVYTARLDGLRKSVVAAAAQERLAAAFSGGDGEALQQVLSDIAQENDLDFLTVVAPGTGPAAPAADPAAPDSPGGFPSQAILDALGAGKSFAGTEVLDLNALRAANPALPGRATVTADGSGRSTRAGMALVAAAPLRVARRAYKGESFLYGGILLDGNHELIDQMVRLIYGRDQASGRDTGAVSIYLGDRRISTNIANDPASRAVGVHVSPEVARAVLREGGRWSGRVLEPDGWHMAAYQPIRDHSGGIVGILGVGLLEAPFLAVRTDMMLTFLIVAVAGVLVVLGLTYLITRSMIHPLEEMVVASNRIAAGDLDHRVNVRSQDEIGLLAGSFNKMLASIKTMKLELEEWGRTLEEKVRTRTEELVTVRTQMVQSEKLASLGRLAAGVAHEINNPLGGILSFSMLALEDCPADHPMRQNLEIIVKQTLRCRETVKGLLDFARQSSTPASAIEVSAVVDKTLSLLENQSIFHDIRIVKALQPALPNVLIDAGQLQQVVVNIVLNAVDAMEESGVLTVETLKSGQTEEVLLRISDTGKGIAEDVLPFIFEPFFTTKKVGRGTGLGLSIVHGIVTRAGGKIDVATSPKGTVFTVRVPIADEEKGAGAGSRP